MKRETFIKISELILVFLFIPNFLYGDSSFRYPLDISWNVIQNFGVWNSSWGGYHLAEDATADIGTPVYAAAGGNVKFASTGVSGYGGLVIIEHDQVCTLYGHLSQSLGIQVNTDQQVTKGQLIGYIADPSEYGYSGPSHIHFGIRLGQYTTQQFCGHWAYVGYTQSCEGITHEQYLAMWNDPSDFIEGKPTPVVIFSPGNSTEPGATIISLTPTLEWNDASNADYYALAISQYPYGSSNIIYNPQQLYGTSVTVPVDILEYGKKYRWNIQAYNSSGLSDVSNTLYFYTSQSIQTISLISPPNNSTIITATPTFKWSSASNADYYGLYISKPPYGPDNLVFDSEEDYGLIYDTTFTEIPSNIFINGVKYYWNVRAHFSSGWGDFSDSYNFTADFDDSVIIVPDDYSSIQTAIDSSDNGYTIIIKDGTYTENLDINKSLTIKSENGPNQTTIQAANSNDYIFYIYADSITITGIKITGTNSSAIYACYSSLKMENVNISDNGGDAIRFDSGNSFTLRNCNIERNGKGIRYDGYAAKGNAIVENNLIKNNGGSGLYINLAGDRSVTIRHNVIDSNSGNGIYCYIEDAGGTAIIEDNVINYSGGDGICLRGIKNSTLSGIAIDNSTNSGLVISSGSNLTLEKPFSITNSGSYGIYLQNTEIKIDSLIITDNTGYGIFFYYGKALSVRECDIERNGGGIIYTGNATGDAIVENNKIKNNTNSGIAVKLAVGRNASIKHNEINSCSGSGIYCSIADAGGKANIEDNVINYSGAEGIYLSGVKNSTLSKITIDPRFPPLM
ncbi:MAG: right-handed parallel beta-helix repeat-containing protein [Candidatus Marinimicrobia bacterium]|nr:right-handed parallel beta-helix repeat-containing protein [Candidatus Neomarinimicrobiota bacterium]